MADFNPESIFGGEPPKNAPTGGLVVANAAGAEGEFPVLKAFQEFIEAERAQARKRMMVLSLSFGAVLVAVIAVFFAIGMSMFSNMSNMQARLLDAALRNNGLQPPAAPAAAPVVVNATPAPSASSPEVSAQINALTALINKLDEKKTPAEDPALAQMRQELAELGKKNEQLNAEIARREVEKTGPRAAVSQTQYDERGVGIIRPASYYRELAAQEAARRDAPPAVTVSAEISTPVYSQEIPAAPRPAVEKPTAAPRTAPRKSLVVVPEKTLVDSASDKTISTSIGKDDDQMTWSLVMPQ